jgi:hypothetical protein
VDLDGSETLTVALLGLPDGAVLSAGTRGADGAWTVPAASLPGLMLTPPPDFAGTLALTLRAIATEARGASAATERAFKVTVAPRADAAQVAAAGEGAEDSWIAVRGTLATTDRDGSESLGDTLTVSGVPAGAVLNGGTEVAPGTWEVPRSLFEAGSLAIRPPADSDADIALRIGVRTLDGASAAVTEAVATVLVRAVADAPSVQVADAHGREDEPIRLAGLGGALADTDGSETLHFVLSGVPASATLSAGTRGADGTWTLTPAQLATVSITPPAHFSGSMNLVLAAVATEAQDGAGAGARDGPLPRLRGSGGRCGHDRRQRDGQRGHADPGPPDLRHPRRRRVRDLVGHDARRGRARRRDADARHRGRARRVGGLDRRAACRPGLCPPARQQRCGLHPHAPRHPDRHRQRHERLARRLRHAPRHGARGGRRAGGHRRRRGGRRGPRPSRSTSPRSSPTGTGRRCSRW